MGVLSQQHTRCDALIVQAVSDALNVTINITESIEGWATVTVKSLGIYVEITWNIC